MAQHEGPHEEPQSVSLTVPDTNFSAGLGPATSRKRPRKESPAVSSDQVCGASSSGGGSGGGDGSAQAIATPSLKLRCPLCPERAQKRFKAGRSMRMHLRERHADHPEAKDVEDWDDFEKEISLRAVTFTKNLDQAAQERLENGLSRRKKIKRSNEGEQTLQSDHGGTEGQSSPKTHHQAEESHETPDWVKLAQDNDIKGLEKLEKNGDWVFTSKDRHGSTAEQYAAGAGAMDCLRFCIAKRHNECPFHGPLHDPQVQAVAFEQSCTCAPTLASRRDGRAALHWACRNGQLESADFLVRTCHVNINAPTFDGSTPLMYAVFGANLKVAQKMVTWGADPHLQNSWACGLVHWIAISRCQDQARVSAICDWLANALHLDFTNVQKEGRSPLHKAAYIKNEGVINWMLQNLDDSALCQCSGPDQGGLVPSELARRGGHNDVAVKLLSLENRLRANIAPV